MSTFKGRLADPNLHFIAIDNFECDDCEIFLLSHSHSDHMTGLLKKSFQEKLNTCKSLYCSGITARFLRNFSYYQGIEDHRIIKLKDYAPKKILKKVAPHISKVTITALPVDHCLGAVMFLIQYTIKGDVAVVHRTLYTGDFRLSVTEFEDKLARVLKGENDGKIDHLYLDTTFAISPNQDFFGFPPHENCIRTVIDLIKRNSCEGRIFLHIPYMIGYEDLFVRLRKEFKKPVIVHPISSGKTYIDEIGIPDVRNSIVAHGDEWHIHACHYGYEECMMPNKEKIFGKNPTIIKPCSFSMVYPKVTPSPNMKWHKIYSVPYIQNGNYLKVFMSNHASLSDLKNISALMVSRNDSIKIYANVLMKDEKGNGIQESHQDILKTIEIPEKNQGSTDHAESATSDSIDEALASQLKKLDIELRAKGL